LTGGLQALEILGGHQLPHCGLLVRSGLELGNDRLHVGGVNGFSQKIDVKLCQERRGLFPGQAILTETGRQEGSELCDNAYLFFLVGGSLLAGPRNAQMTNCLLLHWPLSKYPHRRGRNLQEWFDGFSLGGGRRRERGTPLLEALGYSPPRTRDKAHVMMLSP